MGPWWMSNHQPPGSPPPSQPPAWHATAGTHPTVRPDYTPPRRRKQEGKHRARRSGQYIHLRFPGKDRFPANPLGRNHPVLGHFAPGAAGRRWWPVPDAVLCGWVAGSCTRSAVGGEVRDDHDRVGPPAALPGDHLLSVLEVGLDELRVVDHQSG